MKRIWAPWRKAYITSEKRAGRGCVFCRLCKSHSETRHYILKRSLHSFAVLNLYPYNNGHILILPKRHVAELEDLSAAEKLDWLGLCEEMVSALRKVMSPKGFNLGMNFGTAGGAGIPGHLHMHVVPRWPGDVNFMPVIGSTKVISESLDSVYRCLRPYLKSPDRRKGGKKS